MPAPNANASPVLAFRLGLTLLGAVRIGPTPPPPPAPPPLPPPPLTLEFWGDAGLRALRLGGSLPWPPLVLVVVRLGKLAWPWLLPADRGLGEDAVGGGGEIVAARCALCCACGCEARFTKPRCMCCGGECECERAANEGSGAPGSGALVNWDAGAVSERGV